MLFSLRFRRIEVYLEQKMDELGAVLPGWRVDFLEIGALFPTLWQQLEQRVAWMYGDGTEHEQQGCSNLRVEFATGRVGRP